MQIKNAANRLSQQKALISQLSIETEQTVCMRFRLDGCWAVDKAGRQSHLHGNPSGRSQRPSKTQPLEEINKKYELPAISYTSCISKTWFCYTTCSKIMLNR